MKNSQRQLELLREQLNQLIENNGDPKEILKLSVELDKLIDRYMDDRESNN